MPCRERRYRDIRDVMVGGVRVLRQIWVGADGNAIVTFDLDIERLPAAVNMLAQGPRLGSRPRESWSGYDARRKF